MKMRKPTDEENANTYSVKMRVKKRLKLQEGVFQRAFFERTFFETLRFDYLLDEVPLIGLEAIKNMTVTHSTMGSVFTVKLAQNGNVVVVKKLFD